MQLAQAPDYGLIGRSVALELEARVLHLELVQHFEQALLVALLLGLNRDTVHRRGKFEGAQVDMVLVVRIVQHAVELDLLDLGHRADVPRNERIGLDVVLALYRKQVPDLEGAPAVADEELRVRGDRSLVHAEDPHLADEGIDDHLEHVREHVRLRPGHRVELLRLRPFAF